MTAGNARKERRRKRKKIFSYFLLEKRKFLMVWRYTSGFWDLRHDRHTLPVRNRDKENQFLLRLHEFTTGLYPGVEPAKEGSCRLETILH